MNLLGNIKRIREIKKITQTQMADKLNTSLATYGKVERGEVSLTIDRFEQICEILNLQPWDVYLFDFKRVLFSCEYTQNEPDNKEQKK